ncbi:hypothetical protein EON63_07630 [archaeon]|nr:MAG: hypothetical protein EON63_07630 [archaeon]
MRSLIMGMDMNMDMDMDMGMCMWLVYGACVSHNCRCTHHVQAIACQYLYHTRTIHIHKPT